jgi:diaminohydroxyphosphoribosylaminopyrimidine deaminase/5-amino-6-(5-phosphoribosylamino)uracil reductase
VRSGKFCGILIAMNDKFYMKRSLKLALKARSMTSPNPMVGALLVKNGRIISEDFHRRAGTPHAEVLAIEKAEGKAKGSTLYINLEPCCHTEKRTPPCTKAIISEGIKEVVIGMKDPNPKVSGRGISELQKAGIHVRTGILENEAKRLNESYIKYITKGIPFVIMKIAMTLDGKIATPEGQSKWITSEKSRNMVHRLRSSVDSIITAIGTVKADDPELTARVKGGKNPLRIIIDPDLEIALHSKVLQVPPQTIIVTKKFHSLKFDNPPTSPFSKGGEGGLSNERKIKILLNRGIQFIEYEGEKADLQWLMKRLGERQIISALIEAGSSFNACALEEGIVDKVMFFISPKIIGGRESFPAVGGRTFRRLEEAYRVRDVRIRRVGEDILVEGYIEK